MSKVSEEMVSATRRVVGGIEIGNAQALQLAGLLDE